MLQAGEAPVRRPEAQAARRDGDHARAGGGLHGRADSRSGRGGAQPDPAGRALGYELSSGAVRNHRPDVMIKAFEIAGYGEADIKEKFGALYDAFQYGAPPHAGMAPGVDRIVMLLTGEENIREVIPFPLNSNAQDLMFESPREVTEQQLREVHIKIR